MMLRLLARSFRLHLGCFVSSFGREGREVAPLGPRRWCFLLLLFPLGLALQGLHWLGFLADDLFFRGWRRAIPRKPVFITGLPRSGTTFVHRLLASDSEQFSTFSLWEVVLAPSVSEKRILRTLARLDGLVGSPLKRVTRATVQRLSGEFGDIHEVGPQAPEEDYLCLLPVGGCFLLSLAFPQRKECWHLADFPTLPQGLRKDLLGYYRRCLQAHQYVRGKGRRILSKNAAFASWVPDLQGEFPEATFILCIRDPQRGLSSQLSSIVPARTVFGADPDGKAAAAAFPRVFADGYRILADAVAKEVPFGQQQVAILDQQDLQTDAEGCLRAALAELGISPGAGMENALSREGRRASPHQSSHRHRAEDYPVDMENFLPRVQAPYAQLRARRPRAKP
ncbi:MAG: hypothetical protein GVY10_02780 [Verrucomicrobia bacterium]|jgi:hypothetical protein|nr:hypothetical protein [Verrucomicrobiota bacterium]